MDEELLIRCRRYMEWCETYSTRPLPEAIVCFRFRITSFNLGATTTCADLLAVMEMLKHDTTVQTLDVSNCAIGDSGALAIADGLTGGSGLRELIAANARIGDQGAAALFKAAQRSLYLRSLNLSHNKIGPNGSLALSRLLEKTRTLTEVDIRSCGLGSSGLRGITAALLERAAAREWRRAEREALRTGVPLALVKPPPMDRSNVDSWLLGGLGGDDRLVVTSGFRVKLLGGAPLLPSPTGVGSNGSGSGIGGGGGSSSGSIPVASSSVTQMDAAGASSTASAATTSTTSTATTAVDDEDSLDITVQIGGNFVVMEVFSSAVHALGLLLTVLGAFPLLAKARHGDAVEVVAYTIFIGGLTFWWATALLSHSLNQFSHNIFRRMTQPAAFLLIACTYSPFILISLRLVRGAWGFLAFVFAIASLGALAATTCPPTRRTRVLLLVLYLICGYLGVAAQALLPACLPAPAWQLLYAGGALFTLGVFIYARDRPTNATLPLWYFCVLCGTILHYIAVLRYVETPSRSSQCVTDAMVLGLAADPAPLKLPAGTMQDLQDAAREVLQLGSASALASREQFKIYLQDLLERVDTMNSDL